MTDQELNEAVARKLGWTDIKDRRELGYGIKWTGKNPNKDYSDLPEGYDSFDLLPSYSTDIAAAWEIVERLFESEWAMELESYPIGREWMCRLSQQGEKTILGEASTAPRSICEAFLKLP